MTDKPAKKVPSTVDHETSLAASLRADPAFAADYLSVTLEEGTQEEFMFALRRVVKAYLGIANLAAATGLNENTLHRTLSARGNPRMSTFLDICKAIGMQITITPVQDAHPPIPGEHARQDEQPRP